MDDWLSIAGLDPAVVMHALYHATRPLGMGRQWDRPDFSVEDARQSLAEGHRTPEGYFYFDYVCGRPFKMKFDEGRITTLLYDRDAGPGTAERVVEGLRGSTTTVWDHLRDDD